MGRPRIRNDHSDEWYARRAKLEKERRIRKRREELIRQALRESSDEETQPVAAENLGLIGQGLEDVGPEHHQFEEDEEEHLPPPSNALDLSIYSSDCSMSGPEASQTDANNPEQGTPQSDANNPEQGTPQTDANNPEQWIPHTDEDDTEPDSPQTDDEEPTPPSEPIPWYLTKPVPRKYAFAELMAVLIAIKACSRMSETSMDRLVKASLL